MRHHPINPRSKLAAALRSTQDAARQARTLSAPRGKLIQTDDGAHVLPGRRAAGETTDTVPRWG
jgi:hypothetical protein